MFALWRCVIPACIFVVPSGFKADADAVGPNFSDKLVVEHAEILLPASSNDTFLEGFLVIWNGTGESTRITEIRSDVFSKIELVQTVRTRSGLRTDVQASLLVPAHAELLMRPGGVYLLIDPGSKPPRVGGQVNMEIFYADGASETIVAQVSAAGTVLEDHHHGMPPTKPL
ncbi:copper chaperone PCu(A)C [Jiella pacifica]|uniref:Copper chaperone PCu(A)C n=1 Tax=Jiella pacifica TaxID=2696469 RepID=A0A6N9TCN1_9HYPH|nr:copper chaperone PCu(A)C [Jiella pacifica]NDW07846.1 copper chaperone PCu(A)C [Jiella pacifica]